MRNLFLFVIAFAVAFMFSGDVMAADGAALFAGKCIACHGKEGVGTPMAPALKGNEFVSKSKAEDIQATIVKGRKGADKKYPAIKMDMPTNDAMFKLKPEEIDAVVAYLKSLNPAK